MTASSGLDLARLREDVSLLIGGMDTPESGGTFEKKIDRSLNDAVSFLTKKIRMQHLRTDGSITLSTGVEIYDYPDDFSGVIGSTFRYRPTGQPLEHMTEDDYNRYYLHANDRTGEPRVFTDFNRGGGSSVQNLTVKFRPTPSSSENGNCVDFQYYRVPKLMEATTDFPDLPAELHDGLKWGACVLWFSDMMGPESLAIRRAAWSEYIKQAAKFQDTVIDRSTRFRGKGDRARRPWYTNFDLNI